METHGVLVGWYHHVMGPERIVLTMQMRSTNDPEDVDLTHALLTREQATLLGNTLFELAGQTAPPSRARGWLRRMFG
jgi:hypothetical protein